MKTPDLSYLNDSKLPGVSPFDAETRKQIRKAKKEEEKEPEETRALKEMYPDAKGFCPDCGTPIYEDGGECPRCN